MSVEKKNDAVLGSLSEREREVLGERMGFVPTGDAASATDAVRQLAGFAGLEMKKCAKCGTDFASRAETDRCPPCDGRFPLEHYGEGMESERDKARATVLERAKAHWHSEDVYTLLQRALAEVHSLHAHRRVLRETFTLALQSLE
jgi:hypothetical protein